MRATVFHLAVIGGFALLLLSLFHLQFMQGSRLRALSDKNCIRLFEQEGARGKILDRAGDIIVDSALSYDVMVVPQDQETMKTLFEEISKIVNLPAEVLKKRYRKSPVSSSLPVLIVKDIDLHKAIALEERKIDLNGVTVQLNPIRNYPYGSLASHVIGYLQEIDHWRLTKLEDYGYKTRDIVGYTGVEEKYDYYLRPEEGGTVIEVDHRGRLMRILGVRLPKNGKDIWLTLDLKMQKIVEDVFIDRSGSVVIMDPYSGEIAALTNGPNFNPLAFVKKNPALLSPLFTDPQAPLLDRTLSSTYPAASVFKLVVAAAALDTGKINPAATFVCPGYLDIGNKRFKCWETHGAQDLSQAIAHSCDVYFYHTGLLLGAQAIHDWATKFGFGKPTQVDLPYEVPGVVPGPLWKKINRLQAWYDGDTANFSIGQGDLLVTPLQVAKMTAVFANQGFLVTPYIVKAIDGKDMSSYKKRLHKISFKKNTLEIIREGMREAVSSPGGTAGTLSSLPVAVAGKTGTAQVTRGQPHAWFAGFFPFDNPKYVIVVFLEHGGSGQAAVGIAKQIIEGMTEQNLL